MTDAEQRDRRRSIERHAHSVVLGFVSLLLTYAVSLLVKNTTDISEIRARNEAMSIELSAMYRASDARRDMADVGRRLDNVEHRVDRIEDVLLSLAPSSSVLPSKKSQQ